MLKAAEVENASIRAPCSGSSSASILDDARPEAEVDGVAPPGGPPQGDALRRRRDRVSVAVETVAQTVQTTLTQGGETGNAAAQLGVGAVEGAIDAVGADLTTAAVGAVEGAIAVAKETGINVAAAAAAAATGTIEAAGEVSNAAAVRVRRSVEGTIQGVKVVASTAVGKDKADE